MRFCRFSPACTRAFLALALLVSGCTTDYGVQPYEELGYDQMEGGLAPAEYGPANWIASPNYVNASRKPPKVTVVVVHTTQGSFNGAVSWQQNPKAKVSAHYTISKTGKVTQMVKEEDIAWHVGSENGYTIGIEHEGFVTDPTWVTPALLDASAKLTCYLVKKWKLPATKAHIKGHVEMPNQTHTDPGKYWPWAKYIPMVAQCVNGGPPPPPVKAGCCSIKIPASGSATIDDKGNDCVQMFGPAGSWWSVPGLGQGGSMTYTYTSAKAEAENWTRWRLTFAKAGKYKVEAFIPAKNASAKPTYKIKHGGTTSAKVVDQKPLSNVWTDLGTYDFKADCDEYVSVGDNTGQAYTKTIQLGIDAVRVTSADQACGNCDDKNACTDDACVSGACKHTNNAVACDDGNACTSGGKCAAGKCAAGTAKDCNDKNACTDDSCAAGACKHANNTAGCDDGNACTAGGKCAGGKCAAGAAKDCNDKNACTDDSCVGGVCKHANNTAGCDDGDACTSGGKCAGGACAGGKAMNCNDNNACTSDSCSGGKCVQAAIAGACDDGDACSVGDACAGGVCLGGLPVVCNDNIVCTDDSCAGGTCISVPNTAPCDDGAACTTGDKCTSGVCLGGPAKDCNDGNACTNDTCIGSGCQNAVLKGGCDDGDACTENDSCSSGKCKGTAKACDDDMACSVDSCVDGECQHDGECAGDTVDGDATKDAEIAGGSDGKGANDVKTGSDGKTSADSKGLGGADTGNGAFNAAMQSQSPVSSGCQTGTGQARGGLVVLGLCLLACGVIRRRRQA